MNGKNTIKCILQKNSKRLKEILKKYINKTITDAEQQKQQLSYNYNNDDDIQSQKSSNTDSYAKTQNKKIDISSYPTPAAIETLSNLFHLSEFEKSILILCAGIELDSEISYLCSLIHGGNKDNYSKGTLIVVVLLPLN